MQSVDQIISARWVLPIAPQNIVLEDHSVAISNNRIIAILPTEQMLQCYQAPQSVVLKDHVLLPGLVNAHAHTPMNLFRGLADDLPLMDWLQNHIWPAEQAIINATSVTDGARLAIAEMLRGGITCFNDHYFFPDAIATTAIDCGMRAVVGLVIMSVPTQWAADEEGYFEKARNTLKHGAQHELIHYALAPHAPYTVSDRSLKQVKAMADEHALMVHMHVHETAFEVQQSLEQFGMRPLARLNQLGLLAPNFISVHMVHCNSDEIALVRDSGTRVVHCPESNLKLASGFAPIATMLDAGIEVAIGTDGAASNNDLDLFAELRTAALLAKAVSSNPTALSAPEALRMATLNGAKALGLEQTIGSIEAGKCADLIAVDLSSYLTQPVYNPMSHLVYAISRLQVSDVWINGKQLLKQGEFVQLDTAPIVARCQQWLEKGQAFKNQDKSAVVLD